MQFQERLTFANVVSVLALIVALAGTGGGVAYAHGKIGSAQLKTNAVKSHHIKNGQVKGGDLKNNAVGSGKVKNNSIRSGDVKNRSLTHADISTGADGVALASVSVVGTAVPHQFNRLGGPITVTNPSPGNFDVKVPGADFDSWQTVLADLNAVSGNCWINFVANAAPDTLEVRCDNAAGAAANRYFKLTVFDDSPNGASPRVSLRPADRN
ncbi:hypothetical protein KUV85_11905 [Nocardioides panacisoli]|uniref:hypothetical protein n=1 Tax=Nocardioides panacisoli TaxID=627624 RepID=UPI001C62592B|nr:hypothetical protein [Nocardioides panacisoli]QYJ03035.1 hypothetical protein KUV85_11905 [Nocardioides panacisoli]